MIHQLDTLIANGKEDFDLSEPDDQATVLALAEALLADPRITLEQVQARARQETATLEFKIAAKLMQSRAFLLPNDRPVKIGVVFAMWGEQNRLRPKSAANPHGEDSLRTKIRQLAWVTAGTGVSWALYPVDDGCPYGSGHLAQEIAVAYAPDEPVHVLFLANHLPAAAGPLRQLASADASRKAGAIILGCIQAIADGAEAVIYTDADNSVHLGQLGLLLRPYLQDGRRVVLGNRKHPDAVLIKDAARWGIGIRNLRHMQRMIGEAIFSHDILDTQAAFKLYESSLLQKIIAEPTVFDFSFDTDWIAAFIARDEPFAQIPFAFLDSAAESATAKQQPMTTWETLLLGLLKAMRRYELLRTPASQEMARVIEEEIRDYRDLELIITRLPPELAEAGEADYGDPAVMSPAAMQAWIREQKMAFTDIDHHKIQKEVGGFCMKRTPAHLKDQLRYEYEVADQNVIIYEVRPVWNRKDEYTKLPVAKLTFVNTRKIWKLYWMRASGKWKKYEPQETATDLNVLIREIDKDSYGCFFG